MKSFYSLLLRRGHSITRITTLNSLTHSSTHTRTHTLTHTRTRTRTTTQIQQRFLCSDKKPTSEKSPSLAQDKNPSERVSSDVKDTTNTNTVSERVSGNSPYRTHTPTHAHSKNHSATHSHSGAASRPGSDTSPYDTTVSSPSPFSSYASSSIPPNTTTTSTQSRVSEGVDVGVTAEAAGSSRVWNYTASVNNSLKHIEESLMNRIHESNKRRFRFMFFGSLGAIAWFFIVFGGTIGRKLKSMTTGLALETLEDKSIKIQTEELARAVVQTVLNDKEVTAQAASFLREASHAPETQEALLKLTLHVLKHPDSLTELSLLTKNVLASLSHDPEAIKHLAVLFSAVFQDPELKQCLNVVASEICKSPEVVEAASELTAQVFQEPVVQEAVNNILVEGSSNVMKNEELSVQSREFVAAVMGDDSLQREGGTALWNSIYHAIVPGAIRYGYVL